jgi:S1-C subfamily serine protease
MGCNLLSLTKAVVAATAFVTVLCAAAPPVSAQERRIPNLAAEARLSYAPVVQRAAPAVVNVYAARTVATRNPLIDDPFFRRFFQMRGCSKSRWNAR